MFASISKKLQLLMTINIIFFIGLVFVSNTFFSNKYYTERKKTQLLDISNEIEEIIENNDFTDGKCPDNVIYNITRIEKNNGAVVSIGKLDGTMYYPLNHESMNPSESEVDYNPFIIKEEGNVYIVVHNNRKEKMPNATYMEDINSKSFFVNIEDPNLKIETLRFQTELKDGLTILIWVPIDQISESISVSNTFIGIIGLITIFLSSIWILFVSKNFTSPITKMNHIAMKMANLDFSERINIQGKDEIAQLSQSINYLSSELDVSINELNAKNKQLESDIDKERKIDKMRKEFVSNVSHDLKSPIFLIQGYAEALKSNISKDEQKRDFYCDVIMAESEKMNRLVIGLLDLSQMESGTFSIDRMIFDIADFVNSIIRKMDAIFSSNNIIVNTNIPTNYEVNADITRIEQVLVNLINNAINHVDENKVIVISLKEHENKARIYVYNSGNHIPKDSLDKIWTSFYKVDKARTREYGGSGLGLSIVKAIQNAHNNDFGVKNVKNGVEFWVDLDKGRRQ